MPRRPGCTPTCSSPVDLEQGKITATLVYEPTLVAVEGTYDEVNRLCSEIADKYRWAFVNINLRPYYGEGSKTYGYEIAEQLGWRAPAHVVVPVRGRLAHDQDREGIPRSSRISVSFPRTSTRDARGPGRSAAAPSSP